MARFTILDFYILGLVVFLIAVVFARLFRGKAVGRAAASLALFIFTCGALETASAFLIFQVKGEYPWQLRNPNSLLFERHPYLVGKGRADVKETVFQTTVSHNSNGFRSAEIPPKSSRTRIVALGGSTTYGVAVNNPQTWPAILQEKLGNEYEVLNFGIPAHSTVEHIVLAAFTLPEFEPDIVLIHAGLNDLHVAHTPNLRSDYSNAHAPMAIGNLGLCPDVGLPSLALLRVTWLGLEKLGLYPECEFNRREVSDHRSADVDEHALALYRRNVELLIELCSRLNARVIFLPQILLEETVADGGYQWWTPNIQPEAMPKLMETYNAAAAEAARKKGAGYVARITSAQWTASDFADASHLNAGGNSKFAELVAAEIVGR